MIRPRWALSVFAFACAACNSPPPNAVAPSPPVALSAGSPAPSAVASSASSAAPAAAGEPAATEPSASESRFPKTPPELQVPPNSSLVLKARAKGVQIYECASKPEDARAFSWKLKAPEADLFDDRGDKVARHFAGPTWEATDGSSAVGSVMAKADAPDPEAVPWLLLTAVSKGPGLFARVMHVQRLDTSGGKAPATGCDAAQAKKKAEVRIPYEATYYLYALTPGSK